MTTENEPQTWQKPYRQNGAKESDKAFGVFVNHFLNKDDKITLHDVATNSGYDLGTVFNWSAKYKWFERKRARQQYDADQERKQIKELTYKRLQRKNKRGQVTEKQYDLWALILSANLENLAGLESKLNYNGTPISLNEAIQIQDLIRRGDTSGTEDIERLNKLDDYFKTENLQKDKLTELEERADEIRYYENNDEIKQLEKECEDDDY